VVKIFKLDGVGVSGLEVDKRGHSAFAVRSPIIDEEFAVEIEAIAAIRTGAEAIVAFCGRGKFAGPARRIILGRDAGTGRDVVPLEIESRVDARNNRRTGE
jgi:hypothetical protein